MLAEQDPLINVRQDDTRREISVSLYGEVQKEVIQATLADDFGPDVTFRDTTTIYTESLIGTGDAVEVLQAETHPCSATIGLRIEPAAPGIQLPGLTGGKGDVDSSFGGYERVRGASPTRRRTMLNPLHRKVYLLHVVRRF